MQVDGTTVRPLLPSAHHTDPMARSSAPSASPADSGWHRFTTTEDGDASSTTEVMYGADVPGESVLRLLGPVEGRRIIDLGCGVGTNAIALAGQGAKVIGVEPSPAHLTVARERADEAEVRVEWRDSDLADLAFLRSDSVDAAYSAMALAAIEDLPRVFRQVHRVLKPESPFVFSLPHPAFVMLDLTGDDPLLRLARAYDDDAPVTWKSSTHEKVVDHPRTIATVFTALQRTNFRVDHLLEPTSPAKGKHSRWFTEAMRHVPAAVVFRARKQGN